MKLTQTFTTSAAVALLSVASPAQSAADVDRTVLIATSCFSCHSIDGTGSMPNLVGYPRDMLASQMKAFKDGSQPATIKDRIARGYSEEEIVLMADYLATLSNLP